MLLVILGAGASFDSLPDIHPRASLDWRPPLAGELFSRPEFGPVIKTYSEMAGIVHRLRNIRDGTTVEERLGEIQETYPRASQELMAVRFYLQSVLRQCTVETLDRTSSVTNYATLISKLDRWRQANEEIVVVNFNYDTLFDYAFHRQLGIESEDVDSHINGAAGWRHIKVHGSWEWGVTVTGMPRGSRPRPRDIIRAAPRLRATDSYVWWSWELPAGSCYIPDADATPVMPAIAIPLRKKAAYACPDSHIAILRARLGQANRILAIGWRGQDRHFVEEFRGQKMGRCEVLVVSKTHSGGVAVQQELIAAGLAANFDFYNEETRGPDGSIQTEGAFTRLIRSGKLEEFLSRPVS